MEHSDSPDVLKDKRGPISGLSFFSRSPFYSLRVLVVGATNLVCVFLDASLLIRFWDRMPSHAKHVLIIFGVVLVFSWWGSIRNLNRLRDLYINLDQETTGAGPGSPMDIALGVAAGGITDCLLCISGLTFLTIMYFAYSF